MQRARNDQAAEVESQAVLPCPTAEVDDHLSLCSSAGTPEGPGIAVVQPHAARMAGAILARLEGDPFAVGEIDAELLDNRPHSIVLL